jgi:tetrahedral aminopeptidase
MIELNSFLKEIISLPGLSGHEQPVRNVIANAWQPLVSELSVSPMGSLHGLRRGSGPEPRRRIMLAAHMDAIGLIATKVVDGFLHFTQIGGVDPRILPGTPVIVHGRKDLPGLVVQPADHLLPPRENSKPVEMEHLLVDIGLQPSEVNELVRPGDLISYATQPTDLPGEALAGHSLDDRACVAAVTQCLLELQHMKHAWDVYAVATVQEEVTFAGAYTSPFQIRPDLAIAIDVTFAKGPGSSDYRTVPLGKFTPIGWGPNLHPALYKEVTQMCDQLEIAYQRDPIARHSGTDAYAMQVTAEGIPCMLLEVPLRYMHTPVEVICMKDIVRAGHIMAEFIARLQPDFIEKITWED